MALYRTPDYKSSFESIGLSVQEKKFTIIFEMVAIGAILDLNV